MRTPTNPARLLLLLSLAACTRTDDAAHPSSTPTTPTVEVHDTPDDTGGGSVDDTGGGGGVHVDWDAACNPLAVGDDCFLPYPSTHYLTADSTAPSGYRWGYGLEMFRSPDGTLPVDPAMFNELDGASPISPLLIGFGVDVDPTWLWGHDEAEASMAAGAPIALIELATGARVPLLTELDQTNRELKDYAGRHALIARPLAPMTMGGRYLALITDTLTAADGTALPVSPVFAALRDGIRTDDPSIEAMRDRYDVLLEAAEDAGYAREHLIAAWEVPVASEAAVLGPIRSMRDQALGDIQASGVPYTIDRIQVDPSSDVAFIVEGTFRPPSFLSEDNELVLNTDYSAVLQEGDRPGYEFTVLIPPAARTQRGLPLVVIGHGIFGNGRDMLTSGSGARNIQPLAGTLGAVVVATDWVGLSDGDLSLILSEVISDIGRIRIVTDRLAQSLVNNIALVELALEELPVDPQLALGADLIDPEQVYYYGISLGGIQGTSLTGISPHIRRATVAVPGGGWTHMIQRSVHFSEIETLMDLLYPDPLSQTLFISLLQGFFDRSDPINLGRLVAGDLTLPEAPEKVLLIQEAIGDCQVPNLATDTLARALGAAHLEEAPAPIYGLSTVSGPTRAVALTQYVMPERIASYLPPDENTIPTQNNGTHSAIIDETPSLLQAVGLVLTGESSHPCTGPCDPD